MKLNEKTVAELPAPPKGNKVHYFAGAMLQGMTAPRGFGVNVNYAGTKTFVLNYRVGPRERRITLGRFPEWSALQAVREARTVRQRIDRGEDPLAEREPPPAPPAPPTTVNNILDEFAKRELPKLRTGRKVESMFDRLVRPAIGAIQIHDLRRRHVAAMLDQIEDQNGKVQVDRVRAHLGRAFRWYEGRDEDFRSPIHASMARNVGEARSRVLTDEEIRAIWPALTGVFGDICKVLLLTAQRRGDIGEARWTEIASDVLTIPASRYKTKREHAVPLTAPVLEIINRQLRRGEFVFTGLRGGLYKPFHNDKAVLDKVVRIAPWVLHDLRRTGRSLMARAGVQPHIAERVLGHAMGKVEGAYDRHSYEDEKRAALEALAGLLDRILHPSENVVAIRA